MSLFHLGQVATLDYTVRVDGNLTDPTTISLTITLPDLTLVPIVPTHVSLGRYTADYETTVAGTHLFEWVSTGTAQDVQSGSFDVTDDLTVPVTPDDVADFLAQRVLTKDGNSVSTFDTTTVPTAEQVSRVIVKVTAEEAGGLGPIPTTLTSMFQSLVALAAAVRVLGVYFSGDTARDDLDADLDDLRKRFRAAVDTIATTGDPDAASAEDGPGGVERPPPPAFSFPLTRPADVMLGGVPVTTLTERY